MQEILDERLTTLFQPDTLLSLQYYKIFRSKSQLELEKRLMLAVLEDAVLCFQNYIFARDRKGKLIFQEAEEWILERNSNWLFSFENVCEVLGFNPDYVRQGLLCWKERRLAERAKAKIYRLTLRAKSKKPSAGTSERREERSMRAAAVRG